MQATCSQLKAEVISLLQQVKPLGNRLVSEPATESEIEAFETKYRLKVPIELREWLCVANGANVNPGGMIGLKEIGKYFTWFPSWWSNYWIPIAGDGCGDYWVLACNEPVNSSQTNPVLFIDQEDFDQPAYVVASGLWNFLRFLLEDELILQRNPPSQLNIDDEKWCQRMQNHLDDPNRKDYWPFQKAKVLQRDPCLADYRGIAPFPWETESQD